MSHNTFFEQTEQYEFQGELHTVPAHPEVLLEYHYGKKWRIPGGPHARLQSKLFFWYYLDKQIQRIKRFIKRKTDKKHILFRMSNIARVLAHMKQQNSFTLSEYIERYKEEVPNEYNSWLKQFSKTGNAEEIVNKQLFQFMFNNHGNLGIILTQFDENMDNYLSLPWIWVND